MRHLIAVALDNGHRNLWRHQRDARNRGGLFDRLRNPHRFSLPES